jgi:hypothetical protein
MNAMFGAAAINPALASPTASEASDRVVTLRNSHSRPLRVQATLLAEASSWCEAIPAWQEVVLLQELAGGFAVGLKTCRAPSGEGDVYHAHRFADLEQALAWLQEFDPVADLRVDFDVMDRRISTIELALRAASLRQRADWVRLQYESTIGELLFRLDTGL